MNKKKFFIVVGAIVAINIVVTLGVLFGLSSYQDFKNSLANVGAMNLANQMLMGLEKTGQLTFLDDKGAPRIAFECKKVVPPVPAAAPAQQRVGKSDE